MQKEWLLKGGEPLPHPNWKDLSLPPVVWQILSSRGYTEKEQISEHFSSSLKNLRTPYVLKDMDRAVQRIIEALKAQEKVLIYGDFDLDGSSALALLYDALKRFGFDNIDFFQPKRLSDGYGLHSRFIPKFKQQGVDLMITVDLGIADIIAAQAALDHGIDLIVSDHHLPQEKLPEAYAVINPNREDCESGLGHLCGAGVAFYLVLALRQALREQGLLNDFNPKELLDLYTIGTLTDMVPLIDENRILVKHGLLQLADTKRPGLRALLKSLQMHSRKLSGQDVAIGFAPKINALSRLELDILPVDLFLVDAPDVAKQMVKRVLKSNEERKTLQTQAQEESSIKHLQSGNENFVWVYSSNFHKGVIGLAATQMTKEYMLPSFIAANIDGELTGSARLPDASQYSLVEILQSCSDHLLSFGGHRQAAGFRLLEEKADDFSQALSDYFHSQSEMDDSLVSLFEYDADVRLADIDFRIMQWLEQTGPFGHSFPVPLFRISEVFISSRSELRGGHLKFTIKQGGKSHAALLFSPTREAVDLQEGVLVDLLVEAQWNYFAGSQNLQLLIRDFKLRV